MNRDWSRAGIEPGLEEALADPIVLLVLRRDRLAPADVRAVIDSLRSRPEAGQSGNGDAPASPPLSIQALSGDPS
jgi:hypothetical protein